MKTVLLSILLSGCLFSARCAMAQPGFTPQPKSKSAALTWSIGATFVPAAVGGAMVLYSTKGMGTDGNLAGMGILMGSLGLLFGPGAGHAYAGREKPMKGAYLRGLGMLIGGIGGLGAAVSESFGNDQSSGTIFIIVAGGVLILTSAVYDIATTGHSVEEYNRRYGYSLIQVKPWYHCSKQAVGFALTLNL